MVAVRSQDADRYLAAPPEGVRLFLIYGNDPGGVTERARLVERVALKRGGGDATIRFGSDEIAAEPGRIAEEAHSASLFGGEPVIGLRILDGRHNVVGALQGLLDRPPGNAWVIVEAGELAPASALRKGFEKAAAAAAVATYHAEGAGLAALIRSAAQDAGLTVDPAAMERLAAILGGDRLASRRELEKLFVYVGDAGTVTLADVEAVVGDTAEIRTDAIVDAALIGDHSALEADLDRLRSDGGSAAALGAQMLRHLLQLAALRAAVDGGSSLAAALDQARPPVFGRRRPALEAQVRRWPALALRRARARLSDAILLTRQQSALENAAVSEVLHAIALDARRLRAERS